MNPWILAGVLAYVGFGFIGWWTEELYKKDVEARLRTLERKANENDILWNTLWGYPKRKEPKEEVIK